MSNALTLKRGMSLLMVVMLVFGAIAAVMLPTVSADGDSGSGTQPQALDDTSNKIVSRILDVIFKIFLFIGLILLAWSIGMLILAFRNEDADSKSRAIMLIAVSIVLIALGALLMPILNATGVFTYQNAA